MPRILEKIRSREADNVRMLGTRNDVEDIVAAADIGVLFTRGEGISNAIVEYMAQGKPVLTTDQTGGSKEIVEDGASGFILPAETGPIERTLSRLLDDAELRMRLGARGRRIIEERFTVQKMGEEFLKAYESLTDK
jgi:glycosyltransferase involved in cell wall biosynthesis